MTTRDQTRRELKNLAKLAESMTDPPPVSVPRSSRQSWTLPKFPRPPAPGPARATSSGARGTMPPVVASVPPPSDVPGFQRSRFGAALPQARSLILPPSGGEAAEVGRSSWAVMAGATISAALVGGLLLGQALSSQGTTGARAAHTRRATATEQPHTLSIAPDVNPPSPPALLGAATAMPTFAPPAFPGAEQPPSAAPGSAAPVVANPLALTVCAPRPVHHSEARPAPKPAEPAAGAAGVANPLGKTAALTAPSKPPAHQVAPKHDSLEDLIRKAAAN